ncbi:MAG: 2'-5' RNA ligase [Gemmatimonadetes bacterium 13_1_40CM_4_69_8]|nr:MAG: 2'-5' RNA ligase [Gemmatimonadetes bacterium 13_1_40CM_4_69_8]
MRLFVALNLPPAVREAVWAAAAPLRELQLPVNWVRADGVHLTLKFLGEVSDEQEPELLAALAQAAGSGEGASRGIPLALGGFGVFPDLRRPRVVWVGVAPEPALELLQHRVEQAFAPLGFPTEGRPFRPHLTLGRAARDAGAPAFRGLAEALAGLEFAETARVDSLDLMESTLQRGGAVYHVRRSERLD